MADRELTLRIHVAGKTVTRHLKHTDEQLERLKRTGVEAGEDIDDALEEAADAADDLADEADKAGKESENASGKMSKLSGAARELGDALRVGDFEGAAAALKKITKISPGLVAGLGAAAAGGTALAAAYGYGTAKAIEFEQQMLGVKKTTGLTGEDLDALSDRLLELSGALGIGRQDLAAIAETAGQLGIEGSKNIVSFTETVAKMAEVSELSADEAATQIAKIANVFDVPIDEAERLGSVLNELSNTTTAKSGQIAQALRRAGQAGADLGLAAEDVAALSATLVDAGLESERAGTGLRNVFTMMRTEAGKVAQVMGVTSDELASMIEEDAMGALRQYLAALSELPTQLRTVRIEETFGRENLQAVSSLVGQTELLSKNLDTATESFAKADSLNREFEATLDAVATQWDRLVNNLQAAAIAMSEDVLPALSATLKGLNSLFTEAKASADELQRIEETMSDLESAEELAATYEELAGQSSLTAAEQERLDEATQQLAERFPTLVTEYTEGGDAAGVYAEKVQEAIKQEQKVATGRRRRALKELGEAYATAADDVQKYTERANLFADDGNEEALGEARRQADAARQNMERLAEEVARVFDPSETEARDLQAQLQISAERARRLLGAMQDLETQQTDTGDAAGDQAEELTAAQRVQRGMIRSIAQADAALSELQTKFKEATTAEARREYQQLIEKVEQLKQGMIEAAQAVDVGAITLPSIEGAATVDVDVPSVEDLTPDNLSASEGAFATVADATRVYDRAMQNLIGSGHLLDEALNAVNQELTATGDPQKREALLRIRQQLLKAKDAAGILERGTQRIGQAAKQAAVDGFVALGEAIGDADKTFQDFGRAAQSILSKLAKQIGQTLIAMGTSMLFVPGMQGQGAAYIAAGTALTAIGAATAPDARGGGSAQEERPRSNVPRMNQGGRVQGGTPLLVGDGPGGQITKNTEMFVPDSAGTIIPSGNIKSMVNAASLAPPTGDTRRLERKLDEVARRFEEKQFRLRGQDQVTQQERAQAQLDDAGIK